MTPCPIALGLMLCDQVIVEKRTEKVSLIGQFSTLRLARFPGVPLPWETRKTPPPPPPEPPEPPKDV
jgi:hypothetical protein